MSKQIIGIIPAAGKGSRLAPFPCPKELFPVGYQNYLVDGVMQRRPKVISQYLIENILLAGAQRFLFIVSEGKGDIMRYYGDGSRFKTAISYLFQETPDGMPGAINLAKHWVEDATILFGMPDTIIEPHDVFQRLLQQHREKGNELTLGLFPTDTPSKFGMVELDAEGNVVNTVDKPKETTLEYMWGCACWEQSFTSLIDDYLNRNLRPSKEIVLGDIINDALQRKMKVGGVMFADGKYIDIGTSEELDKALKKFHL
jgi:glucose-1-phosphate thymidylyltransferase